MNIRLQLKTIRPRFQRSQSAFTLIELLVVIAIMGIIASLLVGLAPVAGAKMSESRVRSELSALVMSIEAYKDKYGFYPPDGLDPVTGLVDPRINPLYYELGGTQVLNPKDAAKGVFKPLNDDGRVLPADVQAVFGRDGFANAAQDRRRLFTTTFRASQHATLSNGSGPDIEILVAGAPWPMTRSDYPIQGIQRGSYSLNRKGLNPWRYVSSNPTNNPTSFDLWAEIPVRDRSAPGGYSVRVIGNWKNR